MLQLPKSWLPHIWEELKKDYMKDIDSFFREEIKAWKTIYPDSKNIFNAFKYTDFEKIHVVILGQDPYHGAWQAHGLSFSVLDWVKVPPSLKNIYKEIESQGFPSPSRRGGWGEVSGNLETWARQWVLLLNSVLTVEAWKPASHSKIWWQQFTDTVIKTISDKKKWVVFLLWWAFAIGKQELINTDKHLVLTSPHPSPFSVYKWFYGNMHFLETNKYLQENWKKEIIW